MHFHETLSVSEKMVGLDVFFFGGVSKLLLKTKSK